MECNKDEAERAKTISESMLVQGDIPGARKFALKAQKLYPELHGLTQHLCTVDVHFAVRDKLQHGETNWYAVLQLTPDADESTIKKQYRKLALLLHPDKNKAFGAEAAFKCISEGWRLLSDAVKKVAYDSRHKAAFKKMTCDSKPPQKNEKKVRVAPDPVQSQKQGQSCRNSGAPAEYRTTQSENNFPEARSFWTRCPSCRMHLEYEIFYLNKNLCCAMCHKVFFSKEITVIPVNQEAKMVFEQNGFGDARFKQFHAAKVNVHLDMGKSKIYSQLANGTVLNQRGLDCQAQYVESEGPVKVSAHSELNKTGNGVNLQSRRMEREEIQNKAGTFEHCNDKDPGNMQGQRAQKASIAKRGTASQRKGVKLSQERRIKEELSAKAAAHAKQSFDRLFGRTKCGETPAVKARNSSDTFSEKRPAYDDAGGGVLKAGKSDNADGTKIPIPDVERLQFQDIMTPMDKASGTSGSLDVQYKDSNGFPQDQWESQKPSSVKQKRSMASPDADRSGNVSYIKKPRLDEVRSEHDDVGDTLLKSGKSDFAVCVEIPIPDVTSPQSQDLKTPMDNTSATSVSLSVQYTDSNTYPQAQWENLKPSPGKPERSILSPYVDAIDNASSIKKSRLDEVRNGEEETSINSGISMDVPDAEFYDFGDDSRGKFCAGQMWALYDEDGMPRYYAQVKKVLSTKPFKVQITWLEAWQPSSDIVSWLRSGFSYTCGDFKLSSGCDKLSTTFTATTRSLFSHQMKADKDSRGIYKIYPRTGEVWALYKNWDGLDASNKYELEMVEVLEGCVDETGLHVSLLSKLEGFTSLFCVKSGEEHVKQIPPEDFKSFSHFVPAYRHKSGNIAGVIGDCWELDPASTPICLVTGKR